jgi:hypothetical protein
MMEAVRTSETSVDNHFTRQYIPEDNSEQCFYLITIIIRFNMPWHFQTVIKAAAGGVHWLIGSYIFIHLFIYTLFKDAFFGN